MDDKKLRMFRLIWRWTLIIGWFIMGMLALCDAFSPEENQKCAFIACLLLVGYNAEKLIYGK